MIASRERGARARDHGVEIEGVAQEEARREVARAAELATRGERIDRFFEQRFAHPRIGLEIREPRAGLATFAAGAAPSLDREQLVQDGHVLGRDDRGHGGPAALGSRGIVEYFDREIAERVVQPQALLRLGRRFGFALEVGRRRDHVAFLGRELGEGVPRTRAARIELDRGLVVARCVRGAQRTDLGDARADQARGHGTGVLRDLGVLGERPEMQGSLAPQLARVATLAERERDIECAAIEAMRFVQQLMRFVAIFGQLAAALEHLRELLGGGVIRRGIERIAQHSDRFTGAVLGRQEVRERECGRRAVGPRAKDRAQPPLAGGTLRERSLDDHGGARFLELAGEVVVQARQPDGLRHLVAHFFERRDSRAMLARLARAACTLDRHRDAMAWIRLRRRIAQQGLRMATLIVRPRRSRSQPLEAGQVLRCRREQVAKYDRSLGAVVELVIEDRDESHAQGRDVVRGRAAIDRLVDARRDDLRGFFRLAAAREHVGIIDEPAHVIRRMARGLRDEHRRGGRITRGVERTGLTAQHHGLLDPVRARRDLTADLGKLAPALELGHHLVERLPRIEIGGPTIDDRAIHRRRLIEPPVIAIELAGGAQRGARTIILREPGDALERFSRLLPRPRAAIEPREPIVMLDVLGLELDDSFHRRDGLDRLIEVLVDIGELLEKGGLDVRTTRGRARFILE